jgi:CspA family cold shock protein
MGVAAPQGAATLFLSGKDGRRPSKVHRPKTHRAGLKSQGVAGDPGLTLSNSARIRYVALARVAYRRFSALRHQSFFPCPLSGKSSSRRRKSKEIFMAITGTVKFFNATKGFGFISPDAGGEDSFVHISAVERAGMATLEQNQRVSYELEASKNGKMAACNLQNAD